MAPQPGSLRGGGPGRPLWTLAARGGEGQATFFVDAGILTSDFPCSAWGWGLADRREQRGGAGGGPALSGMSVARGSRQAGPVPAPGPRLPEVGRPLCKVLIPARPAESHVGAGPGMGSKNSQQPGLRPSYY